MKKKLFALFVAVLLVGSLNAQSLTEDFDAYTPEQPVFPPDGWVLNGTIGSEWSYATTPYEGVYNAWTDMLTGGECGLLNCNWTTVPLVDPIVEFYYRGGYEYYAYNVAFTVEVATTRCCPSQFDPIYDSGAFYLPDIYDPYTKQVVDLSAFAGQDILIGWRCYLMDNPTYELQLDSIWLGSRTTVDVLPEETFAMSASPFPPTGWTVIIPDAGNPNDVERNADTAYDGIYNARFSSYSSATDYTQYLVTKQFYVDPLDDNLTFWHACYNTYGEDVSYGVSTQNTDPSLVTFGTLNTYTNTAWTQEVINLGAEVGTNVYVWIKYTSNYMYYWYTDLYEFPDGSSESFEVSGFPPTGWTTQTAGLGNPWVPGTGNDGDTAICIDGPLDSTHQDEWLISPSLDCSTATSLNLAFWSYFYRSTISGDTTAQVLGSIDDGGTWPYEIVRWDLTESAGDQIFDISAWADGQSQVKIAFRFSSSAETTDYDDWEIDKVYVGSISETMTWFEGFETIIPESGWPPTGWSTVIYSGTGDWIADDYSYEAPPNSVLYFASADDYSGIDFEAGLFTPSIDFSAIGNKIVKVEFDHHFDKWSTYTDTGEVRTYSGGVYQETLAAYIVDTDESAVLSFDPNPGYPDLSDIQIEFYYYDGLSYAEEWTIDNVNIHDAIAPPGFMNGTDNDDNNAGFQSGKMSVALKKSASFQAK